MCKYLPDLTVGNSDWIYLAVSTMDSSQLYSLSSQLLLQEFEMFGNNPAAVIGTNTCYSMPVFYY